MKSLREICSEFWRTFFFSRKAAAPDHWHIAYMGEKGFEVMPGTNYASKEECQNAIDRMSWHEPECPKPVRCRSEHFSY